MGDDLTVKTESQLPFRLLRKQKSSNEADNCSFKAEGSEKSLKGKRRKQINQEVAETNKHEDNEDIQKI